MICKNGRVLCGGKRRVYANSRKALHHICRMHSEGTNVHFLFAAYVM